MERVPCQFEDTELCPVYQQEGECYEDRHHLYYPANEYKTPIEKRFRRLGVNVVEMCRALHNVEHAVWIRTPKPSRDFMAQTIADEKAKDT
jgi:hypothetical protein